ncbi:hypothetical protein [Pseudoduganella sp. RAF53_2]|uniref:hypothetical protein n=1 Tax=unclassified Pseudoduganella TaxID=2637179 RepID=UPI003F97A437
MDILSAVENIRRRAESVALAHPERHDEALDLADLAELTFQEKHSALLSGRETAIAEIAALNAELTDMQNGSFFARLFQRGAERQLRLELESALQKRNRYDAEIERARDSQFNNEQSRRRLLDMFESLRRNKIVRKDALGVCQAAEALMEDLRKNIQRRPDFARKFGAKKLLVPMREAFDLNDANTFLLLVRREMQAVMDEL